MNKLFYLTAFILLTVQLLTADGHIDLKTSFREFKTDLSHSAIDFELIFDGGPGKDGIPALNRPLFVRIGEERLSDEVMGILVTHRGLKKFYPYNILVWHEIVNDTIADLNILVTFCPLCGSAIVFDPTVNGSPLLFGVSGKLYQSNLLMYDNSSESLWSQSRGEALVGELTGIKLKLLPIQLISYGRLKKSHPLALVMSRETGYRRDYDFYPYGDYLTSDRIYFPISVNDRRYPLKEIFYAFRFAGRSVALRLSTLKEGERKVKVEGRELTLRVKNEEITVTYGGEIIPGYYEMWFSWAIHNREGGVVIE